MLVQINETSELRAGELRVGKTRLRIEKLVQYLFGRVPNALSVGLDQ